MARQEFKNDYRKTGERYFEHLRRTTIILVVYLGVRDWRWIAASLLHDLVENKPLWTIGHIEIIFDLEVANMVLWLTKRKNMVSYYQSFSLAPREFFLIKLSDRLDNLMTFWGWNLSKIQETKLYYMVFARKYDILVDELSYQMSIIEKYLAEKQDR